MANSTARGLSLRPHHAHRRKKALGVAFEVVQQRLVFPVADRGIDSQTGCEFLSMPQSVRDIVVVGDSNMRKPEDTAFEGIGLKDAWKMRLAFVSRFGRAYMCGLHCTVGALTASEDSMSHCRCQANGLPRSLVAD